MDTCAVLEGYIPKELLDKFFWMRRAFEALPNFEGEEVTCHAVCTAFALSFGFTAVEGKFGKGEPHSWLIDPNHPNVVMDMYPIAGATPFIIYVHWLTTWGKLYKPETIEYDIEAHDRQVQKILSALDQLQ